MSLVVIFGPPAVGKMAVGMALQALTGLRLLHNHMTIELAMGFFPYGEPPFQRLVSGVRRLVAEEVAGSDLPGLIFTKVWDFDDAADARQVEELEAVFERAGRSVAFVELEASQAIRIARNRTPLRLAHKPSKRDLSASDRRLKAADEGHRLNSSGEFDGRARYLRIDNSALEAGEAARIICERLALPTLSETVSP